MSQLNTMVGGRGNRLLHKLKNMSKDLDRTLAVSGLGLWDDDVEMVHELLDLIDRGEKLFEGDSCPTRRAVDRFQYRYEAVVDWFMEIMDHLEDDDFLES